MNERNLEDVVNTLFQGRLKEETKMHLEKYKSYIYLHNHSSDSCSESSDHVSPVIQVNKDFKPNAQVINFHKNQQKGLIDKDQKM